MTIPPPPPDVDHIRPGFTRFDRWLFVASFISGTVHFKA